MKANTALHDARTPATDAAEIDLVELWNIFYRSKWSILGFTGVVVLLAAVVSWSMTPVYKATATLLIETKTANVVSIEEVYADDFRNRNYIGTQREILQSRHVSEAVISRLGLHTPDDSPETGFDWRSFFPFLPTPEALTEEDAYLAFVNRFRSSIEVEAVRNSQLVSINYSSTDPQMAARIANELGESYITSQLEARLQMTRRASEWLTDQLDGMRKNLEVSEQRLQQFREEKKLVDVRGVQTLTAKELDLITQQLVDARARASVAKNQLDSVTGSASEFDERWYNLERVLDDPLVQTLKERESGALAVFNELNQRYGPMHPKLINAKSSLASVQSAHRTRVIELVRGLDDDHRQAVLDQQGLERAFERAKSQIQRINRQSYELSELQREVDTNRQLYETFFTRFKETSSAGFEPSNVHFVDRALAPRSPIKPRKKLIVLGAALLAFGFAFGVALLLAFLDNTIHVIEDVENKLQQPLLGVLPIIRDMGDLDQKAGSAFLDEEQHGYAEAVRTIRTGIKLYNVDEPPKRIVVTSSVPAEGKTTLAVNLAAALGQMEKTVLIDADMRRPTLGQECGLPRNSPGLSQLVSGQSELEDCIHPVEALGVDVIPAGAVPPNPLELISSVRFSTVLELLGEKYDRVIIDSSPTQAVSDSLVLSSLTDAVIYVVKADSTAIQIARSAISRLLRVNAPLVGIVLNQFDAVNASKYGYYSSGYYQYYGYGYTSDEYASKKNEHV